MINEIAGRINAIGALATKLSELPQLDAPVKHHFSDGVYAREIFMPKGMLIVGKIHKTKHLNIVSKGKCSVVTSARTIDIEAPFTFESVAGEQKVVYMYEDTVWTTIHVTSETNLDKIEEECIAKDYDETLVNKLIGGMKCLGVQ